MNSDTHSMNPKEYLLQYSDCVNFVTGRTRSGEQAIMGVPGPYVAGVFFDSRGVLLRHEARQLHTTLPPETLRPGKVRGRERTQLWDLLKTWTSEIGFVPATISVRAFLVPHLGLSLSELPKHLQEILEHLPLETEDQYRQECLSDLEEWRRLGKFVLSWGNEYWLNSAGEVTDT